MITRLSDPRNRVAIGFWNALTGGALAALAFTMGAGAQSLPVKAVPTVTAATEFQVESYYRIRWGSEAEFLARFEKNHLPFIRRQLEKGIPLEVRFDTPREHLAEESRWDLRMTLVYRDAAAAYAKDNITEADYSAIVKDEAAEMVFQREEALVEQAGGPLEGLVEYVRRREQSRRSAAGGTHVRGGRSRGG